MDADPAYRFVPLIAQRSEFSDWVNQITLAGGGATHYAQYPSLSNYAIEFNTAGHCLVDQCKLEKLPSPIHDENPTAAMIVAMNIPRCLIRRFDGAIHSMESYGTDTSRLRHDNACHPRNNTAIASFERGAEPRTWNQRENRFQTAKAPNG
ncbi:hypothetical protein [Ruegeria sp. Alg231-54]|uniref:hypothetical protein n=1 Tax=Ruegeria sp. Alg231-54 TaxID=1922221 RepID=UPI0019028196|nr:hypothetical protein [Ruegeria sp. Alg231-54]